MRRPDLRGDTWAGEYGAHDIFEQGNRCCGGFDGFHQHGGGGDTGKNHRVPAANTGEGCPSGSCYDGWAVDFYGGGRDCTGDVFQYCYGVDIIKGWHCWIWRQMR